MNHQKILIAVVYLSLIGATTGLILHAKANQRMGEPGVRTRPLPGSKNLQVVVPDQLPGYTTTICDEPEILKHALPEDTSYGGSIYTAPDKFHISTSVVLMGTDRSSIHKPQICLTGQGWAIDDAASKVETIHMKEPIPYELPVMHLTASFNFKVEGQARVRRGVYLYWYVDGSKLTAENMQMMWWMARDMVLTGVLDRFAYVTYFSECLPGQEEATYERMKQVIEESVPKFQLVPRAGGKTGGS